MYTVLPSNEAIVDGLGLYLADIRRVYVEGLSKLRPSCVICS